jgi:hypothetical protein
MPGKRHSEEQIVYAVRQVEGGKKVSEVCREMGVSQQAFYSWRRRYAGLGLYARAYRVAQRCGFIGFFSSANMFVVVCNSWSLKPSSETQINPWVHQQSAWLSTYPIHGVLFAKLLDLSWLRIPSRGPRNRQACPDAKRPR